VVTIRRVRAELIEPQDIAHSSVKGRLAFAGLGCRGRASTFGGATVDVEQAIVLDAVGIMASLAVLSGLLPTGATSPVTRSMLRLVAPVEHTTQHISTIRGVTIDHTQSVHQDVN